MLLRCAFRHDAGLYNIVVDCHVPDATASVTIRDISWMMTFIRSYDGHHGLDDCMFTMDWTPCAIDSCWRLESNVDDSEKFLEA